MRSSTLRKTSPKGDATIWSYELHTKPKIIDDTTPS